MVLSALCNIVYPCYHVTHKYALTWDSQLHSLVQGQLGITSADRVRRLWRQHVSSCFCFVFVLLLLYFGSCFVFGLFFFFLFFSFLFFSFLFFSFLFFSFLFFSFLFFSFLFFSFLFFSFVSFRFSQDIPKHGSKLSQIFWCSPCKHPKFFEKGAIFREKSLKMGYNFLPKVTL